MIVDTHCHLYFEELNKDLDGVLSRANELGVNTFICVGTNINDSHESLTLAQKYKNIYATAGIHPHDSKDAAEDDLQELRKLLDNEKIVAVGEMGLDYFRNISNSDTQKIVFKDQLKLAEETNKPIVFHNREADEDMMNSSFEFLVPAILDSAFLFKSIDGGEPILSSLKSYFENNNYWIKENVGF